MAIAVVAVLKKTHWFVWPFALMLYVVDNELGPDIRVVRAICMRWIRTLRAIKAFCLFICNSVLSLPKEKILIDHLL